ncbi:thermonuclease family protein [Peteryoungia ipomoeae]|uniref:Thermonuclease family protein n=1 Tax=Peteryoungia ipomoeae TaxID=1210932 RepID=A0A4S8NZZ3_9HYPH|nr:thermonuclease family protein [Peteryoungia ipomoeae]
MIAFLSLVASAPVEAGSTDITGPVAAEVLRVVDGDTVLVSAIPWPDHRVSTYVRLRGIDAPELKSRCSAFRLAAKRAKEKLSRLMEGHQFVSLSAISGDKYFGRVVADLTLADGTRPADDLLTHGLAEPYAGRAKRKRPCPDS